MAQPPVMKIAVEFAENKRPTSIEDRVVSRLDEATMLSVPDGVDLRDFVHSVGMVARGVALDFAFGGDPLPPSAGVSMWGYLEEMTAESAVVYVERSYKRPDGTYDGDRSYVRVAVAIDAEGVPSASSPEFVQPNLRFEYVSVDDPAESVEEGAVENPAPEFSTEPLDPIREQILRAERFGVTTAEHRALLEKATAPELQPALTRLNLKRIAAARRALADQGEVALGEASGLAKLLTGKRSAPAGPFSDLAIDLSHAARGDYATVRARAESAGLR